MATDVINLDNLGGLAANTASGAYTVVMTLLALIIVAGLLFLIWYILQYKHKVIIKKMTKQGFYVVHDKAREVEVAGVKYWKLWSLKEQATIPPPEATHMTQKGKFVAEGYWSEETGIVWAEDQITREKFKERVVKKSTDKNGKSFFENVEEAFRPFTTQERALQSARVTRALTRKRKNLLEVISQLATPVMMVMLMICILIFWEDIYKPVQEQSTMNVEISKQNAEISAQNARMLSLLRPDLSANLSVTQVVTAEGGG